MTQSSTVRARKGVIGVAVYIGAVSVIGLGCSASRGSDVTRAVASPMPAPSQPEPRAPSPSSGQGGEFDRGATASALVAAADSAKSCARTGGPKGKGRVRITFAPNGAAVSVSVEAPFDGSDVGACILDAFRGLRIPAFDGQPIGVSKTVTIDPR